MTSEQSIHVLVFGGMADWEAAYALAELRRWGNRHVVAVGFDRNPVRTMGGLQITPDLSLAEVSPDAIELLILPGGDLWESGAYPRDELESLVRRLIAVETPVAAICAATLAIARAGVLDDRRHTSNALADLERHVPTYRGQAHYVDVPAVRERHVITASGLAAVDFARAVFAELAVFTPADEQLWFDMFTQGRDARSRR